MDFGTNLKRYIKDLGISNYNFSILADINYTHLSNIEQGRRIPTTRMVIDILNTLNMTFNEFMNISNLTTKNFYRNIINSSLNILTPEELLFTLDIAKTFIFNDEVK